MTLAIRHTFRLVFGFFFLLTANLLLAQPADISYRVDGAYVIIQFPRFAEAQRTDELLVAIGSSCGITDSLENLKKKRFTRKGWEFVKQDDLVIEYRKLISRLDNELELSEMTVNANGKAPYTLDVAFGSNRFKAPSVIKAEEGKYTFLVKANTAKTVFLSGTFNNWSTIKTPMQAKNGFWTVSIPLAPGKHLYKFIVDGRWALDPANQIHEMDDSGNANSVFYAYNYTFRLNDYPKAKKVFLAGSFNDWDPNELEMVPTRDGWEFPMYLRQGKHTYKFIVDGYWITDPRNPDSENDGVGNINSVLYNGLEYYFRLPAFQEAGSVRIIGNFAFDGPQEYTLEKRSNGWQAPLLIQPGNYEYQCVVDGEGQADPSNPYEIGPYDHRRSVLVVQPNHHFFLRGFPNADRVVLSGTFNDWSESGYTMKKVKGGWFMDLHLPKGKTRYKFIVDGVWMRDPENKLYELNQYDTFDSVLWIE